MFPYNLLVERKEVLSIEIERIKSRLEETKDPEMTEILKNQLQETEELFNLVTRDITRFLHNNTTH